MCSSDLTGDLRYYAAAALLPMAATPLVLFLFPSRYTHGAAFAWTWLLYALAKLCEECDSIIYRITGSWSGHTLKHLLAAAATYVLFTALQHRRIRKAEPALY